MPKKLPTGLIRRTGRERYYAVFNDGTGRRRQKAHSRDRGVSEQMLRELQRQLDLKSVGLGDLVAQETTLADVEKSYLCDLKTRVTPAHLQQRSCQRPSSPRTNLAQGLLNDPRMVADRVPRGSKRGFPSLARARPSEQQRTR